MGDDDHGDAEKTPDLAAGDGLGHDLAADVLREVGLAAMSIRAELDGARSALAKRDGRRAERAIRECGRHLDEIDAVLDGEEPVERLVQGDLLDPGDRDLAQLIEWTRSTLVHIRDETREPRIRSALLSVIHGLRPGSNPRLAAALEKRRTS